MGVRREKGKFQKTTNNQFSVLLKERRETGRTYRLSARRLVTKQRLGERLGHGASSSGEGVKLEDANFVYKTETPLEKR